MKPIKYFLLALSVLALLACNAVNGLVSTSTPVVVVVTATSNQSSSATSPAPTVQAASPAPTASESLAIARQKIKHIVIIMQENRSFDSYFGTYPGANGFPTSNGTFTACVNDPATGNCVYPYHDPANLNYGGPHSQVDATKDIDNGKMDGFVAEAEKGKAGCAATDNPDCGGGTSKTDVMGYHDSREFQIIGRSHKTLSCRITCSSRTLPGVCQHHLFMVSEWSAKCSIAHDPMSCINALQSPGNPPDFGVPLHPAPDYAWTDLTYLLFKNQVSWKYYVQTGTEPDCEDDEAECAPVHQDAKTPGIWNPLPYFDTVKQDGQLKTSPM